jgi:hypothetical protein
VMSSRGVRRNFLGPKVVRETRYGVAPRAGVLRRILETEPSGTESSGLRLRKLGPLDI